MAIGDTLTITVNAVPKVLNRVNQDNYGSEFSLLTATDSWNLKIRHSTDSVDADGMIMLRHNLYLEHITYPTGSTLMKKETITFTMRAGKFDGVVQLALDAAGVLAALAASSYSLVNDLTVGLN